MQGTINLSQAIGIFLIVAIVFAIIAVVAYGFANTAKDITRRTEQILERIAVISFGMLVAWVVTFTLFFALPYSLKKMKEAVTLPVRTGMHP